MTIYNINLGIGWASSGVEYAQAYRVQVLRTIGQDAKFIFTDMILADNIQHLTANIGFQDQEIIWLYSAFTDIKLAPTSVSLDQVLASFSGQYDRVERQGKVVRYFYPQLDQFMTCYLTDENSDLVQHVEYVLEGKLVRKDYYSYTRYCSEYFRPENDQAVLYQRRFFNEDGSTAYDMLIEDGQEELYRFPDRIFYSKQELLAYFLERLNLTASDMVILDRETGIGQVVFEHVQPARLGIVVHAEHFSANATDDDYILWNNYYDYQFSHADKVDFFIVATQQQEKTLSQQFAHYTPHRPRIFTIPVGSLDRLIYPETERQPYSMLTASRLATEKHIDWLVRATIKARETLPDLTLDIYGSGGEEGKLRSLIEQAHAQEAIRLMGHADLEQVYARYQLYLTASTSEGFGLTLMEALGSGLPIIGFDVPYGNQTFIQQGRNGYLLPLSSDYVEDVIIQSFGEKIIQIYQEGLLASMSQASYQEAQKYLTSQVEQAWSHLIEEVLDDSTL